MDYKKLSEICQRISKKEDSPVLLCLKGRVHGTRISYYANNRELLELLEGAFELVFQKISGLNEWDFPLFLEDPTSFGNGSEWSGLIEAFKQTKYEIDKIKKRADKK